MWADTRQVKGSRTGNWPQRLPNASPAGLGETCSSEVCVEPQAQLVSCLSSLLDLATSQNASPLDTLPWTYLSLCCFEQFSPWFILPLLCLCQPSEPALCSPHPAVNPPPPHTLVCHRMFLTLTEALLSAKDRGFIESLLFLPGPKDQRVGRQPEHSLSCPLLLSIFSLVLRYLLSLKFLEPGFPSPLLTAFTDRRTVVAGHRCLWNSWNVP